MATARIEVGTGSPGTHPFSLRISAPGILDNFEVRLARRVALQPGEVEICVVAAGLNFIDVLRAMQLYPGQDASEPSFGLECSGVVTAVGAAVERFRVGDAVVAAAPGSFGSHVVVSASFVSRKPEFLTHPQAAGLPMAYMTAWYALHHLAGLARGERVLIHSASGGTGLAAVWLAQHLGAEVFATAGTPEKRAYLESLGVAHVMSSRTLDFADAIALRTGGAGVDVVLSALPGEAVQKSLSILAPFGRFVEISKRDIYEGRPLSLSLLRRKNLSFAAVDLAGMAVDRPQLYAQLLARVMELVEAGAIPALPQTLFPMTRAADAFQRMAQARHIGKIILLADGPRA